MNNAAKNAVEVKITKNTHDSIKPIQLYQLE